MTDATRATAAGRPSAPGTRTSGSRLHHPRMRSWVFTAVGAALLVIAGAGTLAASGWDVRLGPVIALATAGAVAVGLLLEVLGPSHLPTGRRPADPWRVRHAVPYSPPGRDTRVVRDAQAITRELTDRLPVADLHHRLAELTQDRLRTAYGVGLGDPRSRELLGEPAHALLTRPPRRLRLEDLTHVIERIEQL